MLTPDEYVVASLNAYPSLYKAPTREAVFMQVMDQTLNVIGNGIDSVNDFQQEHLAQARPESLDSKWITDEALYVGYIDPETRFRLDDKAVYVLGCERAQHPEILEWIESRSDSEWIPYPNFKRRYSLVWQDDFATLGADWIKAAITFYEACVRYFDEGADTYHYAFPQRTPYGPEHSERMRLQAIESMTDRISTYESPAAVSAAYGGVPFDGDVDKFLRARWHRERERIQQFLAETLARLSAMLDAA